VSRREAIYLHVFYLQADDGKGITLNIALGEYPRRKSNFQHLVYLQKFRSRVCSHVVFKIENHV
jgi:hypothetical protein